MRSARRAAVPYLADTGRQAPWGWGAGGGEKDGSLRCICAMGKGAPVLTRAVEGQIFWFPGRVPVQVSGTVYRVPSLQAHPPKSEKPFPDPHSFSSLEYRTGTRYRYLVPVAFHTHAPGLPCRRGRATAGGPAYSAT